MTADSSRGKVRNRFGGKCYRCEGHVDPGQGHFERHDGKWRVQHAECAINSRGQIAQKSVSHKTSVEKPKVATGVWFRRSGSNNSEGS